MPSHYIECPTCGAEGKIDEATVGRRIKCSKCGESFTAEIGGSYNVVRSDRPRSAGPVGSDATESTGAAAGADPELEKLLEKWAEE